MGNKVYILITEELAKWAKESPENLDRCTPKFTQRNATAVSPIIGTTNFTIDNSAEVLVNDTIKISSIIEPANATYNSITWTSSNTAIASIDNTGLLTGKRAGTCIIYAKIKNYPVQLCIVTCKDKIQTVTAIVIVPDVIFAYNNQKRIQLSYRTIPYSANYNLEWTSSNPSIATVQNGVVTLESIVEKGETINAYGSFTVICRDTLTGVQSSATLLIKKIESLEWEPDIPGSTDPENPTPGDSDVPKNEEKFSNEYVDLGTGVLWAKWNVGAENESQLGNYYAWGQLAPNENDSYSPSDYKLEFDFPINSDDESVHLSLPVDVATRYSGSGGYKICSQHEYYPSISGTKYDVARAEWGGDWRMPTEREMYDLTLNCDWEATSINRTPVIKVSHKYKPENFIYLPVGGRKTYSSLYEPDQAFYWSSDLFSMRSSPYYGERVWTLNIPFSSPQDRNWTYEGERFNGMFVRPVKTGYKQPAYVVQTSPNKEYVDLGLPSGLLWAKWNLGAVSENDPGLKYSWGETFAKTSYGSTSYQLLNIKLAIKESRNIWYIKNNKNLLNIPISGNDDNNTMSIPYDYNHLADRDYAIEEGKFYQLATNHDILFDIRGSKYDAASANWGDNWRMSSEWDLAELVSNCDLEYIEIEDINGQLIEVFKFSNKTDKTKYIYIHSDQKFWGPELATGVSYTDSETGIHYDRIPLLGFTAKQFWPTTYFQDGERKFFLSGTSWERWAGSYIRPVIAPGTDPNVHVQTYLLPDFDLKRLAYPHDSNDQFVDLGTNDNILWAKYNLGATRYEDQGDYYAWGETEPKDTFTPDNYVVRFDLPINGNDDDDILLTVNGNGEYVFPMPSSWGSRRLGVNNEFQFSKKYDVYTNIGSTKYDAASKSLGKNWRIPTHLEWRNLYAYCNWEKITLNGKLVYKVTNKSDNRKFIYLPVNTFKGEQGYLTSKAGDLYYQAGDLPSNKDVDPAYGTYSEAFAHYPEYAGVDDSVHFEFAWEQRNLRYNGMNIRPVISCFTDIDEKLE